MERRQILNLVRYWKKQFGLSWTVKLTITKDLKNDGGDTLDGLVSWAQEYRRIDLEIRDGMDEVTTEETIVHELYHVLYESHLPRSRSYDPMYEGGLNVSCKAQVAHAIAARKKK